MLRVLNIRIWKKKIPFKLEIYVRGDILRIEVFTAVTMKNGVFWDVTPCGSCKNRHFGGLLGISSQRASVASYS
jgi:hypothetical protein